MLLVPQVKCEVSSSTYGRFLAQPVEKGWGTTLGNALRRVLLSSLPGAAITWVKIEGVLHEFSTIPHVKEDTVELLLNVKAIRLKPLTGKTGRLFLEVEGEGEVVAGDIQPSPHFEIVNPQLVLATLDSPQARLSMEFNVEIGKGYLPVEKQKKDNIPVGALPVDAIFTPIRRVNFYTEPIRVEEREGEKLFLEVWTDGTITPEEAVSHAVQLLIEQLSAFKAVSPPPLVLEEKAKPPPVEEYYNVPIDELGLTKKVKNALLNADIKTLGQLLSMSREELKSQPSIGDKAVEEIIEKLQMMGLTLKEKR